MTLLKVKVVPGSSRDRVVGPYGAGVRVQVSAPPEGGRANRAVEELLAAALGLKAHQVRVVKGHVTQRKTVEIDGGLDLADVLTCLNAGC